MNFFFIFPLLSLIFLAQAEISHLEVQPAQAQFLTAYREFQCFFLFLFFGFPAFSINFTSCLNKFIPCCCYVRAWSWQVSCSWSHWRWLRWQLKWLLSKFKCWWCWLLVLMTLEKKPFRSGWWWWWWWLKWQLWWLCWWKIMVAIIIIITVIIISEHV